MVINFNNPEQGFYKIRLVKDGPFAPVHILRLCVCSVGEFELHDWSEGCDRYPQLTALRNGIEVEMDKVWPFCMNWPITAEEYDTLLAGNKWAEKYAPDSPGANLGEPVNHNTIEPLF